MKALTSSLQRAVQPEDGVAAVVVRIVEELIADPLLAAYFVGLGAVRHDHVVDALEGVAGDLRIGRDQVEIFLEGSFPVLAAELFEVLPLGDQRDDFASTGHKLTPRL